MQRLTRIMMLIIALRRRAGFIWVQRKDDARWPRHRRTGDSAGGAQKSLENLIGGVSLLMDKAVQVGDFCKIGDKLGTVEDIGLRSLKLRTLDQSLLVVPNGLLAQMQFENLWASQQIASSTRTFHCELKPKSNSYDSCWIACRACWTNILQSNPGPREFG